MALALFSPKGWDVTAQGNALGDECQCLIIFGFRSSPERAPRGMPRPNRRPGFPLAAAKACRLTGDPDGIDRRAPSGRTDLEERGRASPLPWALPEGCYVSALRAGRNLHQTCRRRQRLPNPHRRLPRRQRDRRQGFDRLHHPRGVAERGLRGDVRGRTHPALLGVVMSKARRGRSELTCPCGHRPARSPTQTGP